MRPVASEVVLCLLFASGINAARRIIVDVDPGTDDYLALLMFLHEEGLGEVKIEAITCSKGNTLVEHTCKNVVRLLELTGRTDIPVYKGAENGLIPPMEDLGFWFGVDGFGDLQNITQPNMTILQTKVSAEGIRDIVASNPGEVSLIGVAGLTNIALAMRLFGDVTPNIKDIWIMGGSNVAAQHSPFTTEFNFYVDPEAAFIVLNNVTKPIYILPSETCYLPQLSIDWFLEVFADSEKPEIQILYEANKKVFQPPNTDWDPCDAYLAAVFIDSDKFVVRNSSHFATVELNGILTRGELILDHLSRDGTNVTIVEEIDVELFKEYVTFLK